MSDKSFFGSSLFTAKLLDGTLQRLGSGWFASVLEKNLKLIDAVGFFSLYLWGLAAFCLGIYQDTLNSTFRYSVIGFTWLLLCVIFHYLVYKFLPILDKLANCDNTRLRSRAIPDCVAVVAVLLRAAALLGILFGVVNLFTDPWPDGVRMMLVWLVVWGCADFAMVFSLRLEALSVEVDPELDTPETLIGLLYYGVKVAIKLVPVLWSLLMFAAMIWQIVGGAWLLSNHGWRPGSYPLVLWPSVANDFGGAVRLVLLPVLAYFLFLFYMVIIGLLRALIRIVLGAAERLNR